MNSVNKLSIILSTCFTICLLMFVIYYFISKQKTLPETRNYLLEKNTEPDISQYLSVALKQMIAYEGEKVDSVWVKNENRDVLLKEYVKDNTLLILFYPDHFCGECFAGDMIRYNDLSEQYKGRTIFLSTKMSKRELFFFKKEHNIKSDVYSIRTSLKSFFEEMYEPCFFILDKGMKVRLFFNPDPDQPEMSDWYFNKIKYVLEAG